MHLRTKHEFRLHSDAVSAPRFAFERQLAIDHADVESWTLLGFCELCEKAAHFQLDWQSSNREMPNFRERLVCEHCGLNNRQRLMAARAKSALPHNGRLYMQEQVTLFHSELLKRLGSQRVVGSEYLGFELAPGAEVNGLRHEDALNLSFPDQSFDVIVSNDVLEHVPDARRALKEMARVLKPGGRAMFTVPFYPLEEKSVHRAQLEGGTVVHHLPPVFHGNPLSAEGSLVFCDFGWDMLGWMREAGFSDAYVVAEYNVLYGYLGAGFQILFEGVVAAR